MTIIHSNDSFIELGMIKITVVSIINLYFTKTKKPTNY